MEQFTLESAVQKLSEEMGVSLKMGTKVTANKLDGQFTGVKLYIIKHPGVYRKEKIGALAVFKKDGEVKDISYLGRYGRKPKTVKLGLVKGYSPGLENYIRYDSSQHKFLGKDPGKPNAISYNILPIKALIFAYMLYNT